MQNREEEAQKYYLLSKKDTKSNDRLTSELDVKNSNLSSINNITNHLIGQQQDSRNSAKINAHSSVPVKHGSK